MPVGHFTLPRYTFTDSKLIINLFLDNKVSFNEINQLFSQYIDNLECIFIKNQANNMKSELLDISDLESHDLYHRKINNFLETFKRSNWK